MDGRYFCFFGLSSSPKAQIIHVFETQTQEEKTMLREAYSPFLSWIDPSFKLIKLIKKSLVPDNKHQKRLIRGKSDQTICSQSVMTSPALSIMLFLHDTGPLSSKHFQQHFASVPWKLHHRVELVNIHSPSLALADQKFYQAECDTPLWAVCPVEQGNEYLRFNIFVRNFPAMVEFYRVITGVEMETTKDNFCWFQLYSQPGVKIRLGLKYHKSISPVPLRRSGLQFKVNNINDIRDMIGLQIQQTKRGCFLVIDPDGNTVYLDSGQTHLSMLTTLEPLSFLQQKKTSSDGLVGEKYPSRCDKKKLVSSDSGQFSDSEPISNPDKFYHKSNKTNFIFFVAPYEKKFSDVEKQNALNLSLPGRSFQNVSQSLPDLKSEEGPLQQSKIPILVNITDNNQPQAFDTIGNSDEQKMFSSPKYFLGSQQTWEVLKSKTLKEKPSLFKDGHVNSSPKSILSPKLSVKDDKNNEFYDQNWSKKSNNSQISKNDKKMFFDCNNIKGFVRNNICVENDNLEVSHEIFV